MVAALVAKILGVAVVVGIAPTSCCRSRSCDAAVVSAVIIVAAELTLAVSYVVL